MDLKIGESKMEIEVSKKESFIRQILKREWEFFQIHNYFIKHNIFLFSILVHRRIPVS